MHLALVIVHFIHVPLLNPQSINYLMLCHEVAIKHFESFF